MEMPRGRNQVTPMPFLASVHPSPYRDRSQERFVVIPKSGTYGIKIFDQWEGKYYVEEKSQRPPSAQMMSGRPPPLPTTPGSNFNSPQVPPVQQRPQLSTISPFAVPERPVARPRPHRAHPPAPAPSPVPPPTDPNARLAEEAGPSHSTPLPTAAPHSEEEESKRGAEADFEEEFDSYWSELIERFRTNPVCRRPEFRKDGLVCQFAGCKKKLRMNAAEPLKLYLHVLCHFGSERVVTCLVAGCPWQGRQPKVHARAKHGGVGKGKLSGDPRVTGRQLLDIYGQCFPDLAKHPYVKQRPPARPSQPRSAGPAASADVGAKAARNFHETVLAIARGAKGVIMCRVPGCAKGQLRLHARSSDRRKQLADHVWHHMGVEPFKCNACGLGFRLLGAHKKMCREVAERGHTEQIATMLTPAKAQLAKCFPPNNP